MLCGEVKNSISKIKYLSNVGYHTLRNKLGIWGFIEIHTNFVKEAYSLGLLDPDIPQLAKNRRKGIILIADSTMIKAYSSTKAKKLPDGTWLFTDSSVAFGRPHHKYEYPLGHKSHSLISVTGIPTVSLVAANNIHDQYYIIPLLDEFRRRYPELKVAYIIPDKGYDNEIIYRIIYELYGIIPIIIRKKIVYPKGFTKDGIPLCPFGYSMRRIVIDYTRQRTKYACNRGCLKEK